MMLSNAATLLSAHSCPAPSASLWVTVATGANYPDFGFLGPVLAPIIRDHLQFTDEVTAAARAVLGAVEDTLREKGVDLLDDHHFVAVHVR